MEAVLRARGECPGTEITCEGSVPSVDPDVLLEVPLLTERLRTELALERSVTCA